MEVLDCPACGTKLTPRTSQGGNAWSCSGCRGGLLRLTALDAQLGERASEEIWHRARAANRISERRCTRCGKAMQTWNEAAGSQLVELDGCADCALIFFDFGEIGKVKGFHPRLSSEKKGLEAASRRSSAGHASSGIGATVIESIADAIAHLFD
jgi:Zn-finger nucleic acid-binding protein